MRYRSGLNPRFDGAFLNCIWNLQMKQNIGLNPRFDGAFLNSIQADGVVLGGAS